MILIPYTEWVIEKKKQPYIPECILIYCVEEAIWGKKTGKFSGEYFSMYFIKQGVIFSFFTKTEFGWYGKSIK